MEQTPLTPERQMHPQSIAVLVLGVLSVIFGYLGSLLLPAIIGLILGIISLLISFKVSRNIHKDPRKYSAPAMGINKAGRICSIIGTAISVFHICVWIVKFYNP
jgi:hypothetical protein